MGGRGSTGSTIYDGYSIDYLNAIKARQEAIVSNNRTSAMLNKNSDSRVIRRKARSAQEATDRALKKISELDKAIEKAKRRKTVVPF